MANNGTWYSTHNKDDSSDKSKYSECHWSFIDAAYLNSTHSKVAVYVNDTEETQEVSSFTMYIASGSGTFTWGGKVTGNGGTLTLQAYTKTEDGEEDVVSDERSHPDKEAAFLISYPISGAGGYYSDTSVCRLTTFTFTEPILVEPGNKLEVFLRKVGGNGNCVVAKRDNADHGGKVESVPSTPLYKVEYKTEYGTPPSGSYVEEGKTITLKSIEDVEEISRYVFFDPNGGECDIEEDCTYVVYTHTSWTSDADDETYDIGDTCTIVQDTTFTANWEEGEEIPIELPEAERNGYIFLGWSTSASASTPDAGEAGDDYIPDSAGKQLYAVWEAEYPTLKIKPNGGEFLASSGNIKTTTHSINFKPNYNRHLYTATWNGSSKSFEYKILDYTTKIGEPRKPGYIFDGWAVSSGSGSVELFDANTEYGYASDNFSRPYEQAPSDYSYYLFNNNSSSKSDVTITATWAPKTYTITFIRPGEEPWSETIDMDSYLTMPELPESFDYFKFTGSWALGSEEVEAIGLGENCIEIVSGTDFILTEENLQAIFSTEEELYTNTNIIATALYTTPDYLIIDPNGGQFLVNNGNDENGGVSYITTEPYTIRYRKNYNRHLFTATWDASPGDERPFTYRHFDYCGVGQPRRKGYKFLDWEMIQGDGEVVHYAAGTEHHAYWVDNWEEWPYGTNWFPNDDHDYYVYNGESDIGGTTQAQWNPYNYEIKFNANAPEGSKISIDSITDIQLDDIITLPAISSNLTDYEFVQWKATRQSDYGDDSIEYYNANEEIVFNESFLTQFYEDIAWYTDEQHTITLEGEWKYVGKSTLTIDPNGGKWNGKTTTSKLSEPFETTIKIDEATDNPGYIFDGWDFSGDGFFNDENNTYTFGEDDGTLTARWTPTNTTYTVKHWQQNIGSPYFPNFPNDEYYTLIETEANLIGVTEGTPEYSFKDYGNGFENKLAYGDTNATLAKDVTIKGDGSTVINCVYYRTIYDLTLDKTVGISNIESDSDDHRYETPITVTATFGPGYEFTGWEITPNDLSTSDIETEDTWKRSIHFSMPAGDVAIKAIATPSENTPFTIKHYYMSINGTDYDDPIVDTTQTGVTDSVIALSDYSTQEDGFTYSHGVVNSEEVLTTTIKPEGDLIIELYYDRNQYSVTLNGDSGFNTLSGAGNYYHGSQVTIDADLLDGYEWVEWQGDFTSTTKNYTFTMPVKNVVNDAISTPINYTITIDLDGGSSTPENPTSYTILDTITLNNPTKIGYSFNSWIDDENNKTLTVSFGPGEYGDKYFKALWDPNQSTGYIVNHYIKDVGKTTYTLRDTANKTGETDQVIKISDLLLDYSGCSFSVAKVDGEEVSSTKIKADGTLVVDIYYTRNTYKVSLNLNTGITEVAGEGSYEFEAEVTVTATLAEGYEWLHWSDGVNSTEDQTYTFLMPAKAVTLDAYAAEIVYTLTYDDEDWVYEDGQENPITYTVNTPTFTLYNPLSDERRSFNGWIINGEGNPQMTVTIPKGTTGDMTFTPNPLWHVFTITLNPNGGFYNNSASIYSEEILYGELFTLNDATSNEFEFIGWFNEEGAKIITPTFNMTEDISLTAHWSCDLTIDIGDIGARIYSIDDQIDQTPFTIRYQTNSPRSITSTTKFDTETQAWLVNWWPVDQYGIGQPYCIGYTLNDWEIDTETDQDATVLTIPSQSPVTVHVNNDCSSNVKNISETHLYAFDSGGTPSNTTIKANYIPNEYTLTFEVYLPSNVEDEIETPEAIQVTYSKDGTIELPVLPDLKNYSFAGWYVQNNVKKGAKTKWDIHDLIVTYALIRNQSSLPYQSNQTLNLFSIWKKKGLVDIYIEDTWKKAQVFIYTNKDENKPWQRALPFAYVKKQSDETGKWKEITGG